MVRVNFTAKSKVNQEKVEKEIKKGLREAMFEMRRIAKSKVPVDTGTLKNSIKVEPKQISNSYTLFTAVDYSVYVEFGTFKQPAQPYLRPALKRVREKILPEIMKRRLGK